MLVACQGHRQRLDQEHHTVVVQLPQQDRLLRCLIVLLELLQLHHYRHHQSQYHLVCPILNPQHQCGLGKTFESFGLCQCFKSIFVFLAQAIPSNCRQLQVAWQDQHLHLDLLQYIQQHRHTHHFHHLSLLHQCHRRLFHQLQHLIHFRLSRCFSPAKVY